MVDAGVGADRRRVRLEIAVVTLVYTDIYRRVQRKQRQGQQGEANQGQSPSERLCFGAFRMLVLHTRRT